MSKKKQVGDNGIHNHISIIYKIDFTCTTNQEVILVEFTFLLTFELELPLTTIVLQVATLRTTLIISITGFTIQMTADTNWW
jgi:hypothetical protein